MGLAFEKVTSNFSLSQPNRKKCGLVCNMRDVKDAKARKNAGMVFYMLSGILLHSRVHKWNVTRKI